MKNHFLLLLLSLCFCISSQAQPGNQNSIVSNLNFTEEQDYWSALTQGTTNFYVDILYIYGEFFIGRTMPDSPEHNLTTIKKCYFYPMYCEYEKQQSFPNPQNTEEIFLFINIQYKTGKAYFKLKNHLEPYAEMFSYMSEGILHKRRIKLIVQGKDFANQIMLDKRRYISMEGNTSDIGVGIDPGLMPVIGIDFSEFMKWKGTGKVPFSEYLQLKQTVQKIHDEEKKVRFYNVPNAESSWETLLTAGVDFITTNSPAKMHDYLKTISKD